jgi:putative spermidine/putrescine transport system permease protein
MAAAAAGRGLAQPVRRALPALPTAARLAAAGWPPARGAWLLAAPALALVVLLLLVPTLWLARLSFFESGAVDGGGARFYLPGTFTWAHYRQVFGDPYYGAVAASTVRLTLLAAGASMLLAYPLAVWIERAGGRLGAMATWLVALPKLTNALVLLYGVLLLLGNAGLVNRALLATGVVRAPLPMFANTFAVVAGEVLLILPYPVLLLVGVLRATGRGFEAAARGLGAGPVRAFFETTFRLSLPGALLTFLVCVVWAAGAFAAPLVLGNPSLYTVSVEIHTQTFERVNWPLAASLALCQLAALGAVAALGMVAYRAAGGWRRGSAPAATAPSPHASASVPVPVSAGTAAPPAHVLAWPPGLPGPSAPPATRCALARPTSPAGDALARATGRAGFHLYAALALALLLAPLAFSLLVSVTPGETIALPAPPGGASLRWYAALAQDPLWGTALRNSLLTAALASAVAVPAGAMAAVAVDALGPRHERALSLLLTAPLFVPGVVLGLQALALYHRIGLWGQPYGIGLAHAMWTMPLAFLAVRAALGGMDRRLEEAARGLGAHPVRAFCAVTLPRLWPALGAAGFLCAVMSLNELPMALFLATPLTRTLPTLIWPQLRYNLTPAVAAASGVLLLLTLMGGLAAAALASPRLRGAWRGERASA